jgi:ribosomal protein RSM22 (predicted rRNA methylase)
VNDKPISQWGRLIRQPIKKGGHVLLDSCGGDGEAKRYEAFLLLLSFSISG